MASTPTISGEGAALFRQMFGDVLADSVGILLGDRLHEYRRRNADAFRRSTEEILRERDAAIDSSGVNIRQIGPILIEAQDECRPEIQELWARLMAAALDPNRAGLLRQRYIETIRKFDPLDAAVLKKMADVSLRSHIINAASYLTEHTEPARVQDEYAVSLENLNRLGCVEANGERFIASGHVYLTPFGRELLRALY